MIISRNQDTINPYFAANNSMQVTGKLIQLLPAQTGQGKNGPWKKQEVIIETEGSYPKKICVAFWGDKADEKILQAGNMLKIDFDVESREYNGKWYTDVKAWKAEVAGTANTNDDMPPPQENEPPIDRENDLPF